MLKSARILGVAALTAMLGSAAPAEEPSAETVVATVNGTEITLGEMIALRDTLPLQYLQLPDDVLFNGLLEQMIQQTVLAAVAETEMTRRDATVLVNQRRSYLAATMLDRTAAAAVSDAAIQALFDEKFAGAAALTEYSAAHILVETEDEAKAIRAELDAGADFAALAREKSTGPSGPNGGDLGWFGLGAMVKPFEDAVVALQPGQVSGPVQTQFGWHVIKLNETRAGAAPTLDDAREDLVGELRQKAVEARVIELTGAAVVERNIEGIDPAILKDATLLAN